MSKDSHTPHAAECFNTAHLTRRHFLGGSAALASLMKCTLASEVSQERTDQPEPLQPIGQGKGVFPGRVVWAYDPGAVVWKGPEDGLWWKDDHVRQDRVNQMMDQAICHLAGANSVGEAWNRLFSHFNKSCRGTSQGYQRGQKIAIKPNWVGMIYRENVANPETYRFIRRENYMNTAPQMLLAVLRQLVDEVGVRPADITISDTLAYLVHEYYDILHAHYPDVQYVDYGGKFGRIKVEESDVPLYWSCRPQGVAQDFIPRCFAEADYLINFANFKAHMGAGVTLCAKNHYGSLIRWPVQENYYDMHPNCFSTRTQIYRPLVDLMGHHHLGGKTVLYLIDGLFSGVHPRDPEPQKMHIAPMEDRWSCSLFASQDPVAIDSVAYDFLYAEGTTFARKGGVDDYLHEAALADAPPSGTFYDPNHSEPTQRLASLGVHEHWNNPQEKKYSRNLGKDEGIELVSVFL